MSDKFRSLGTLENFFAQQSRRGETTPVIIAARYTVELTPPRVRSALNQIIANEPLLSCQINEMNQLSYLASGEIDLEKVCEFPSDQVDYNAEYVDSLLTKLEMPIGHYSLPLWRTFVLENHILVWVFDHTLFDGKSGILFHQQFSKYLSTEPDNGDDVSNNKTTPVPSSLDIPLALENRYNVTPPWYSKAKKAIGAADKPVFSGTSRTPVEVSTSSTELFALSSDQTLAIRQRARELGVSLTAVFYAALAQAIVGSEANNIQLSGKMGLASEVPVDARPFFPRESNVDMGCYIFLYEYYQKLSTAEIRKCKDASFFDPGWARNFDAKLAKYRNQRNKTNNPLSWPIGALKHASLHELTTKAKKHGRFSTIEISNLGAVDNIGENISEVSFAQGCNTLASLYTLSVIGIKDKSTNFVLSAPNTCPISDIVSRFQRIIENS